MRWWWWWYGLLANCRILGCEGPIDTIGTVALLSRCVQSQWQCSAQITSRLNAGKVYLPRAWAYLEQTVSVLWAYRGRTMSVPWAYRERSHSGNPAETRCPCSYALFVLAGEERSKASGRTYCVGELSRASYLFCLVRQSPVACVLINKTGSVL
jgi:hypothetical protein